MVHSAVDDALGEPAHTIAAPPPFRRYVRAQLHHLGGVAEGGPAPPKRRLRIRGRTRPGVVDECPTRRCQPGLGPLLALGRGHGLGRGVHALAHVLGFQVFHVLGFQVAGFHASPRRAESLSAFACSAEKAGGRRSEDDWPTGCAATFATM